MLFVDCNNAAVVIVNLKAVGLAPGIMWNVKNGQGVNGVTARTGLCNGIE
jgi:hypothetical protein